MFFSKLSSLALLAVGSWAASLQQVTNFGSNPTNVGMYIYVPDKLASSPAIVVAIHECTSSGPGYYGQTQWAQYAESTGFIVIYPSSPYSGTCWDVSSKAALTHNGGGDSNSIANMVTYTISKYNANPKQVFVTGASSGAMMTNVMAAAYPNLFAAASLYSGVPAGCFVSSSNQVDAWNSTCAEGLLDETQTYWANVVKGMGGSAPYPKMQIWHGSIDTTLYPPNYNETIKQWTGVFGLSLTPTSTESNTAMNTYQAGYTTYNYGTEVQGIYALNVGHTVPEHVPQSMDWFGI